MTSHLCKVSCAALHGAWYIDLAMRRAVPLAGTVNVNARDMLGRTPLHVATLSGKERAAKLLIERGCKVAARLTDGRSCLHIAAAYVCSQHGTKMCSYRALSSAWTWYPWFLLPQCAP
jgi:hypothetical protein